MLRSLGRRVGSSAPVRGWNRFFFEPTSAAPAALVRMGWGVLAAVWGLSLLADIDPFLMEGAMRYDRPLPPGMWNPLDWIGWAHAPYLVCGVLVVSGAMCAVGAWTRTSTLVALLCLVALQRTNTTLLNSGDLLVRLVGLGVLLSPAGLAFSVDAARRHRAGTPAPMRAPWAMRLLQLWIAVGYLLSAWAKVQGDTWNRGTAVGYALRIEDLHRFTPPEWLFASAEVLNLLTWGTLALEASFLFLVWNRWLRPWVIGAGVLFHLGIDAFLDVGFFSWAVFVGYLAFVPPGRAEQVLDALRSGRDDLYRRFRSRSSQPSSTATARGS